MSASAFKVIFLAGLIAEEVIRYPHRMRNKQARREKKISTSRTTGLDLLLDLLAFAGMEIVPLVYIFSRWLALADYRLPAWAGWLGAPIFAAGLWLLWRAHADLGQNWSPTLEINAGQSLVTQGVYSRIRHPIYAAIWLFNIAQALLLQNWVAGLAGLVTFLPVYLIRVPREERMMVEQYGPAYRAYMAQTGGIVPRLGR